MFDENICHASYSILEKLRGLPWLFLFSEMPNKLSFQDGHATGWTRTENTNDDEVG